jgi:hypothetical protein
LQRQLTWKRPFFDNLLSEQLFPLVLGHANTFDSALPTLPTDDLAVPHHDGIAFVSSHNFTSADCDHPLFLQAPTTNFARPQSDPKERAQKYQKVKEIQQEKVNLSRSESAH